MLGWVSVCGILWDASLEERGIEESQERAWGMLAKQVTELLDWL